MSAAMSTPMSLRPVRRVVRLAPCLPRQPSKPPSASLSKPAVRNWVLASFSSLPTVASTKDGSATSRPASATPATGACAAWQQDSTYLPQSCSLVPSRSRQAASRHSTRAPGSRDLSRGARPQVARSPPSAVASDGTPFVALWRGNRTPMSSRPDHPPQAPPGVQRLILRLLLTDEDERFWPLEMIVRRVGDPIAALDALVALSDAGLVHRWGRYV